MNPITHGLIGWAVACSAPLPKRDRCLITIASVIPDFDGLGVGIDFLTRGSESPTDFWGDYHHILGHNLFCAVVFSAIAFWISKGRWLTAVLFFLSFHLHLLGDILGARGPDGDQWPIPYLLPFTDAVQMAWSGQWALNAWPNMVITGSLILYTLRVAWRRGVSPIEFFSVKANDAFVAVLRKRFGHPE